MDDFTFGKEGAAIILARILTEINDKKLSKSISDKLHNYQRNLKILSFIPDKKFQRGMVSLYKNYIIAELPKIKAPQYVKSHLANVMTTNAKEHKRKYCEERK